MYLFILISYESYQLEMLKRRSWQPTTTLKLKQRKQSYSFRINKVTLKKCYLKSQSNITSCLKYMCLLAPSIRA